MVLYALVGLLVGSLLNWVQNYLLAQRNRCAGSQAGPPSLAWLDILTRPFRCLAEAPPLWRELLPELVAMLLFAFLWRRYGPSPELVLASVYACFFLLIFIIDLEYHLVLNAVILPTALLALLMSLVFHNPGPGSALLGGLIGFSFFLVIALVSRGRMGAGDVKLAGLIGLITGFPHVIVALVIGIFLGGLTALFLLVAGIKSRRSYIPYAPFLIIGGLVTLLYGKEIAARYVEIIGL